MTLKKITLSIILVVLGYYLHAQPMFVSEKKELKIKPFIELGGTGFLYSTGATFPTPFSFENWEIRGSAGLSYTYLFQPNTNILSYQLNIELGNFHKKISPFFSVGLSLFRYNRMTTIYIDSAVFESKNITQDINANFKLGLEFNLRRWKILPYIMYVHTIKTMDYYEKMNASSGLKLTPIFPLQYYGGLRFSYRLFWKRKNQ